MGADECLKLDIRPVMSHFDFTEKHLRTVRK